jgi:CMP-N,N'-diacetyllegionaminic acid synthase
MKKLCIIPARGGSKRLPGKNVKKLNNKPLIFHTIDSVLNSKVFDKVLFTSDDIDIISLVRDKYPNVVTDKRPDELSSDTSKVIDTVMYYLDEEYEQTWLTLPTSPLKKSEDFVNASKLLTEDIDSVLSYTEMEFPPTLGLKVSEDNILEDYHESKPWQNGNSRSQDHPVVYRPNGALYGSWTKKLKNNKNYYVGKIKGHFMSRENSVDIDTQFDFLLAETIIKNNSY